MAKQLTKMTWDEVQQEMSIAGNPGKITQLGRHIMQLLKEKVDATNRAELINVEFMLKKILTEIKAEQRRYDAYHKT